VEERKICHQSCTGSVALAKIGKRVGCKIWIAANDQKRMERERLANLCIKNLPSLEWTPSRNHHQIDRLLWLKEPIKSCGLRDRTHDFYLFRLLRMSDLITSSPNLNFPLYIVAPEKRLPQVRKVLSRPTFQDLECTTGADLLG